MTRILVIEDETDVMENIVETLQLEGYEADGVSNGAIGMNLVRRDRPDLVLCDILMPGYDGFTILEEIRNDPDTSTTPVIFLTALSDRDSIRHGMNLGADDYVTKPFSTDDLLHAVRTRLQRHHAIVNQANQRLDRTKMQLARMIAHELRTPLAGINSMVSVFSRQGDVLMPDQLRELLDSISTSSRRLNRVVDQMVFTMQLEMGVLNAVTLPQDGLPMPLRDIRLVAINLARRFAYRQSELQIRTEEVDESAIVQCHPSALKHAFAELITNALAYSPPDGRVDISQWNEAGNVYSSIRDSGPGIPPKLQKQALEEFRQIDRESKEQQGMGLGLPLARRIIEAHRGVLELYSAPQKGTEVVVQLPLQEVEEAPDEPLS